MAAKTAKKAALKKPAPKKKAPAKAAPAKPAAKAAEPSTDPKAATPEPAGTGGPLPMQLVSVNPKDLIDRDGFNVRYDLGDLNTLRGSIEASGVKTPLRGYIEKGKYIITDGHRRFLAIKKAVAAGAKLSVPFLVEPKDYKEVERIADMVRTSEGKPLTMLEEARAYDRMVKPPHSLTNAKVAGMVGKSAQHVGDCLLLLRAEPKVLEDVKKGKTTATLVVSLLKKHTAPQVTGLIEKGAELAGNQAKPGSTKPPRVTARHIDRAARDGATPIITMIRLLKIFEKIEEETKGDMRVVDANLNVKDLRKFAKGDMSEEKFVEALLREDKAKASVK